MCEDVRVRGNKTYSHVEGTNTPHSCAAAVGTLTLLPPLQVCVLPESHGARHVEARSHAIFGTGVDVIVAHFLVLELVADNEPWIQSFERANT